jgi:putative Ca2+/H+ antiporter (TMEM165/GDT1 family)
MDTFFLPLVSAALAEWGDKTQIVALLLAIRFQRPLLLFLCIGAAALINMGIAAYAGSLLPAMINQDASLLFLAVGFAFAAGGALIPFREPTVGQNWKLGAWATAFVAFFLAEFGDKTQFLAVGFSAVNQNWIMTALGSAAGVVLGCAPAILLGGAFRKRFPVSLIRRSIGGLFLLISAILAINVFSLI